MNLKDQRAVDPLALMFHGELLAELEELFHPHVPKITVIQEALKGAPAEDLRVALSRAKTLIAYGEAVKQAIGTREEKSATAR